MDRLNTHTLKLAPNLHSHRLGLVEARAPPGLLLGVRLRPLLQHVAMKDLLFRIGRRLECAPLLRLVLQRLFVCVAGRV